MSCKGCDKRHVGCHATCEDYKALRKRLDERKEKVYAGKDIDRILDQREFDRMIYGKKKKGVK